MNRQEIYKAIEEMFVQVPSFFKVIPNSSLELEWKLFKRVQFDRDPPQRSPNLTAPFPFCIFRALFKIS